MEHYLPWQLLTKSSCAFELAHLNPVPDTLGSDGLSLMCRQEGQASGEVVLGGFICPQAVKSRESLILSAKPMEI